MTTYTVTQTTNLDELCINTIRFLSVDAVEQANSGHPGMPLGAAPMAYVLWTRFLKHNPADPTWFDRDRFVLSAGHGSMLLYSLLHLTGYSLPMEQIKRFRQWGSVTPGHPEAHLTPGVEVTTGPLGQGFGNAVGIAMAEAHLAARFNRPGSEIIDHYTYVLASDGDMMEGVAAEAASLAGHLRLGKLICLYDSNNITLSGSTRVNFTEDVGKRFRAYGWNTLEAPNGNDVDALDAAIRAARQEIDRPTLIIVHTHIGYGSDKHDSYEAHGSPLGAEDVAHTKERLGWPQEPKFYVPPEAAAHFRTAIRHGEDAQRRWKEHMKAYLAARPLLGQELERRMLRELPAGWGADLPRFPAGKPMATRIAGGQALNALAQRLPELIGGSGDLNPSTFTALQGAGDFGPPEPDGPAPQGSVGDAWSYAGRNIHFGVREHGMGAILNGMAAHGGVRPFGATFMAFSDYMRPPIRLAALAHLPSIFIFTHDSIGLGEDGPTHQPVEQLLALRAIPRLAVIRPADANETAAAWRAIVEQTDGPAALVLTRQKVPVLDPAAYPAVIDGLARGAYILAEAVGQGGPDDKTSDHQSDVILVATGSEVHVALAAAKALEQDGVAARVVSMPCWEFFVQQPKSYQQEVFPPGMPVLAIEAGVSLGWQTYLGTGIPAVAVDTFGASAPGEQVLDRYGFNAESVRRHALRLLARPRAAEQASVDRRGNG